MSLDALDGVAADPDHHRVLFENDEVRVLETIIAAGDTTPLHTHETPTVMYVISGSHFHRRDEHGATMVDSQADPGFVLPRVMYSPGTPRHTLQNTGSDDLVVIGVELKRSYYLQALKNMRYAVNRDVDEQSWMDTIAEPEPADVA